MLLRGARQLWGLQKGLTEGGTAQKQQKAHSGQGLFLGQCTDGARSLSAGLLGLQGQTLPTQPKDSPEASCCLCRCWLEELPGWHG